MQPDDDAGFGPPPSLLIPEIRDYQKINAELVALLDRGHARIRLEGAEGQRLLASGLRGSWNAVIEIVGRTGPETAADLDAPGLTVIARGASADGVGRGLRAGRVLIVGDVGDAVGYAQSGGLLVITGAGGHRAGLAQSGGTLAILGRAGRLVGDRQSAGRIFLAGPTIGPFAGRGRTGGAQFDRRSIPLLIGDDAVAWQAALKLAASFDTTGAGA